MAQSRTQFLSATAALLTEPSRHDLLAEVLSTDLICTASGLSRRTFYDQFDSLADFADELRNHFASDEFCNTHAVLDLEEVLLSATELREVLGAIVDAVAPAANRRAHSKLWAPIVDTPMAPLLSDLLSRVASAGMELIEPATLTQLGEAIEWISASDPRSKSLTVESRLSVIEKLICSNFRDTDSGETVTAEEVLAELRSTVVHPTTEFVPNLRRFIIDSTREMLGRDPLHNVSLARVAARVGLSVGTITRTVGTLEEIALLVAEDMLFSIRTSLFASLENAPASGEIMVDHVQRIAHALGDHPYLAQAIATMDTGGDAKGIDLLVDLSADAPGLEHYSSPVLCRCMRTVVHLVRHGDDVNAPLIGDLLSAK